MSISLSGSSFEPFPWDPVGSPPVNFSPMSPKLVRTYTHIEEDRGITMTPLFLRLTS
jgi:hypothetical protein